MHYGEWYSEMVGRLLNAANRLEPTKAVLVGIWWQRSEERRAKQAKREGRL